MRQVAIVVANNEANIRYFILCRIDYSKNKGYFTYFKNFIRSCA